MCAYDVLCLVPASACLGAFVWDLCVLRFGVKGSLMYPHFNQSRLARKGGSRGMERGHFSLPKFHLERKETAVAQGLTDRISPWLPQVRQSCMLFREGTERGRRGRMGRDRDERAALLHPSLE